MPQDLFVHYPEDRNAQARSSGDPADPPFCRRRRVITPSSFVRALAFGWLDDPRAGTAQLAQYASCLGPPLSGSGLRQRFNARGVALLRDALGAALQPLPFGRRSPLPLRRRFNGVYLFDSSVVSLPAGLAGDYPGCGNQSQPNAAVKPRKRDEAFPLSRKPGGRQLPDRGGPEGTRRLQPVGQRVRRARQRLVQLERVHRQNPFRGCAPSSRPATCRGAVALVW